MLGGRAQLNRMRIRWVMLWAIHVVQETRQRLGGGLMSTGNDHDSNRTTKRHLSVAADETPQSTSARIEYSPPVFIS